MLPKDPENPIIKATGVSPAVRYEKMSKSKFNGVDPTTIIEEHASDIARLHLLHAVPVNEDLQWNEQSIVGMKRWMAKVFDRVNTFKGCFDPEVGIEAYKSEPNRKDQRDAGLWKALDQCVTKVGFFNSHAVHD